MADEQENLAAARSALKECLQSNGGSWSPTADNLAKTLVFEMLKSGRTTEQAHQELKEIGVSDKGAIALIAIAAKQIAGQQTESEPSAIPHASDSSVPPWQYTPAPAAAQVQSAGLFGEWARYTFGNLGWLVVGVLVWTVLISVISIPIVLFFVLLLKVLPNLWRAVFSIFVSLPILLLLPFHALGALMLILAHRRPRYDVGLYAAARWVNGPPIWNPFDDLPPHPPKAPRGP